MCGLFCSIWRNDEDDVDYPDDYSKCKCAIMRRGPDYIGEKQENLSSNWKGFFAASVLWMQGPELTEQPIVDSHGNILLWNGDIFSGEPAREDISDTLALLNILRTSKDVPKTLMTIKGPYSIVYYRAKEKLLYFGRDRIGRHSLLLKISQNCDRIIFSSSTDGHLDEFFQVPAIGIFHFDLEKSSFGVHPWHWPENQHKNSVKQLENQLGTRINVFDPIYSENIKSPINEPKSQDYIDRMLFSILESEYFEMSRSDNKISDIMRPEILQKLMKCLSDITEIRVRINRVLDLLKKSIRMRIEKKPRYCQNCVVQILRGDDVNCKHAKLGILFSGGLDSTILAALADEFIPRDESIDLINVAFEKARKIDFKGPKNDVQNSDVPNFDVPDRKTGKQALGELQKISPNRTWNFVECNITRDELQKFRSSRIRDLVYPSLTILDDSLGCALWFASRASGVLSRTGQLYNSPCRVILLGMGADELFGGYTRHRTILRRHGWSALRLELDDELAKISERNLGRDDRVVSDHGRQSRFPYLDEDFIDYVSSLEAWQRCNPTESMPAGFGDKLLLRLVAHDIGLCQAANFPKRAFQFGSRIANSKEHAKDVSKWL